MTVIAPQASPSPSSIVVLETNVWLSTRLLNQPVAAALLFSLRRVGRLIGFPEVVEMELEKNAVRAGLAAVGQIKKGYDTVAVLMGARDDYRVPSEGDFLKRLEERLAELKPLLEHVPFTLEHARAALLRVSEGTAPNGPENQQFKDSAIWEAVRELALTGRPVDLITRDGGFYETRDAKKGLASSLRVECERDNIGIRVFPNVDAYLASLKQEVPAFDVTSVTNRIAETIGEALRSHAEARGFELGALETHKLSAYVTERSNTLALSWTLLYEGFDPSDPTQPDVVGDRVLVRGTSYFDYATNALSEVQTQAIEYRKANGEVVAPNSQQTHWMSAAFFGGRGTVRHQFKEPVDL